MQITTLDASEYKGYKVYIRNFHNIFEYLVVFDGLLYTAHIVVTKTPLQYILGKPFTKKQLEAATKYLTNTAQATVDFLIEKKQGKG